MDPGIGGNTPHTHMWAVEVAVRSVIAGVIDILEGVHQPALTPKLG